MVAEGGFFQWCGGWVFGGGKHDDFFFFFSPVWVSRSGGGWSLWGCGGCLCLDKFGVGLKGLDALIPSRCCCLGISVTAHEALSSDWGIHRSVGVGHDLSNLGLVFHVGVGFF